MTDHQSDLDAIAGNTPASEVTWSKDDALTTANRLTAKRQKQSSVKEPKTEIKVSLFTSEDDQKGIKADNSKLDKMLNYQDIDFEMTLNESNEYLMKQVMIVQNDKKRLTIELEAMKLAMENMEKQLEWSSEQEPQLGISPRATELIKSFAIPIIVLLLAIWVGEELPVDFIVDWVSPPPIETGFNWMNFGTNILIGVGQACFVSIFFGFL